MKNLKYIAITTLLITAGCNDTPNGDNDGEKNVISTFFLSSRIDGCQWINFGEDLEVARLTVINSMEELENATSHLGNKCDPSTFERSTPMDFSTQSILLLQRGWVPGFSYLSSLCPETFRTLPHPLPTLQRLSQNEYRLIFEEKVMVHFGNTRYSCVTAFVVDKISSDAVVEVDMNIRIDDDLEFTHDPTASIVGKWKIEKRLLSSPSERSAFDHSPFNTIVEFTPDGFVKTIGSSRPSTWPFELERTLLYELSSPHWTDLEEHSYIEFFRQRDDGSMLRIDRRLVGFSSEKLILDGMILGILDLYLFSKIN